MDSSFPENRAMTSRSVGRANRRATRDAATRPSVPSGKYADGERVLRALARQGLLLLQDPRLPSVAGLVAGGPVHGSWWGHPKGQQIFRVSEWLADHPEVLVNRLVSRKVTYVHRRLWPAILAVARAREPWQTRGLSRMARAILTRLRRFGRLRTDRIAGPARRVSGAARELEERLLVHTEWIHTERGAHARMLETWDHWARRNKLGTTGRAAPTPGDAVATLERLVAGMNADCAANGRLPWQEHPGKS